MDVGIPQSILSTAGEVVFNILDGAATAADSLAGAGYTVVAPVGLPDGNGYLITYVGGNDGAQIRNPVTNKPHSHGAIVHRFRRTAKIIYVEGLIVASAPRYRVTLSDALRDVLNACLQAGVYGQSNEAIGRYFWTPAGQATRFHAVRLYEPLTVEPQSPGSAAPKTFSFSLVSEHAEALSYSQSVLPAGVIPNNGNTATWPVIKVYAPTTDGFVLSNGTYQLEWGPREDGTYIPQILGDYIEIDMFRQTMYWDGDGPLALRPLHMGVSDFWTIPIGGATVTCLGLGGGAAPASIQVLSNDAWVG